MKYYNEYEDSGIIYKMESELNSDRDFLNIKILKNDKIIVNGSYTSMDLRTKLLKELLGEPIKIVGEILTELSKFNMIRVIN